MSTHHFIELHDPFLQAIREFARQKSVPLYVVGGYVRDTLRAQSGQTILKKDIDFTVIGDAVAFARDFARHFHSKAVVYERFRTAMVPVGDYLCEFVGTRKEEYEPDSRKPRVTEGTLTDDLRRRDFTVNTLAVALSDTDEYKAGDIIDLFGGLQDLSEQLLRTPLDPVITFNDDPLRMMRAARFASQLGYFLDPQAINAMKQLAGRIAIISQERITDELLKILAVPAPHKPSTGLKILYKTGLLKHIFPEVHALAGVELAEEHTEEGKQEYRHKDVFYHTLQVVDNVAQMSPDVWLRFATLMHDIAKPKTKKLIPGVGWSFHGHEEVGARWQGRIFRRLKLPLQHLSYVETLVRLHQRPMALVDDEVTDSAIRRLIVQADDTLDDLFTLCRADITTKNPTLMQRYLENYDLVYQKTLDVRERDALRAFQSPVRGEEIMALCGVPPSPVIGYIKTEIEEAILDGIIPNTYEAAKEYFLAHRARWIAEFERTGKKKHPAQRSNLKT